jgi:hypothetical protein
MAPTHTAAVPSVPSDAQLAHRAAVLIGCLRPRQKPELAVADLLERLQREKQQREARGLNHWDAHAPRFLGSLIRQARAEKRKRHQEAEAFYKAKRREALRFARVIVGDSAGAEAVTAETYRELLEGGTTSSTFFSALVGNARNYLEGQARRNETFQPFEGAGEGESDDFARYVHEPISHHLEDQDPLEILIAREEQEDRARLVVKAKQDPRWRFVKRKKWARPLLEDVPN